MTRLARFFPALLLTALSVVAQGVDLGKAVQQAMESGALGKAQELCNRWIAEKPDDDRPHIILGKLHVDAEQLDEALAQFEIARDLDPKNPEPLCEAAGIFLRADMAEDAIVEFKAALELRPDYAPAVKGLAEAEALLADPFQNGVWIGLGEFNDERGLKLVETRHPGRVVTIGGRECRATDKASRNHWLDLDVDDAYLFDVDLPVRVTVAYYDVGRDRISMRYDSTDLTAYDGGASKVTESITKTDTKTWKEYTFLLPDAKLASPNKRDLVLWCDAWRQEEDLYVSSVHVVQGGLQVRSEPLAATVGGVGACTVTAKVFDAAGAVADGTPVRFTTDRGTIAPEVQTTAGEAKAEFRSGDEAGEANVTVSAEADEQTVTIPILRGVGKIVRRRLVVHPFGGNEAWETSGGRGTELRLEPAPESGREGRPATRVAYKVQQADIRSMVNMSRPMPLPGRVIALGLWVRPDQSRNSLHIELADATGQFHGYILGYLRAADWQWMEIPVGPALHYRGGANDGRLHFPLRLNRLTFRRYYGGGQHRCEGEVYFQDLTVETDIPGSETISLDIAADGQRTVLDLAHGITFRVGLDNVTAQAKHARLQWSVMDDEDRVVTEGDLDDLEISPETRTSRDVALDLTKPGVYRVRFTLGASGEEAREPSALPSEEMAFLLLRKMTDVGMSADTEPTDNGLMVRLTNQGEQAAQVSLSYRLLNEKKEILRRGALGRPDMEMGPGEILECPLTVEGLPPDRYSILLLLDAAGDQRFASLLSHEVFPNQVALAGRVVGQDDRPIPGASVRARLLKRPHQYSRRQDESVHAWETETDQDGQYALEGLNVPGDLGVHHLYVEAVAKGFVDAYRTYSLRRLLNSRQQAIRISTLRLTQGVKLAGRVIGGDGKPVPDASVYAMTVAVEGRSTPLTASTGGRRIRRPTRFFRPRMTDADGRIELSVYPEASTELAVCSSQWAPKRVVAPAGQPDLGDIQLERGTVVSGRFLDEEGQPAVGYWVVAESTDPGRLPTVVDPMRGAAKTGPEGAFELPPLKGRFVVYTPEHFLPWMTEALRRSPRPRLTILPQTLELDGTRDRVTLELRAVPQVSVSGRVLDIDGTPAKKTSLLLRGAGPGRPMVSLNAVTDENGRYVFEGIPRGLKESVVIIAPTTRPWKRKERIYLRPKPLAHVEGARDEGVHVEHMDADLTGVDFKYQFWHPEDGFLAGEAPGPVAEEEARGETEARLKRMKEQAPDFSLTVFPVLVNQIEKQDLVPDLAKAMAMFFERAGVKRIEVREDYFRPTDPRDAWRIAREFGNRVKDKPIETDYAVFAEFIGTQETGPDRILTIVVDKAGDPVWVDTQTGTDPLVKGIKEHTPLTCCCVSVEKLRRRLGLTDPTGEDAVKGEWSKYYEEKAKKRAAERDGR